MIYFVFTILVCAIVYKNLKSANVGDKIVVEAKECPPHPWKSIDVVDQHGNVVGTTLRCSECKKSLKEVLGK